MNAFVTGSRAYGKLRANSDLDLVIRCDESTLKLIQSMCGQGHPPYRFGHLNLITCTTDEEFAAWRYGTDRLRNRGNVIGWDDDLYQCREVPCRYCGEGPFFWVQMPKGWRLVDEDGELHFCSRYAPQSNPDDDFEVIDDQGESLKKRRHIGLSRFDNVDYYPQHHSELPF